MSTVWTCTVVQVLFIAIIESFKRLIFLTRKMELRQKKTEH